MMNKKARQSSILKLMSLKNLSVIIAGCTVFTAFSLSMWPGLFYDAAFFTTPIISLANGDGWRYHGYLYYLKQSGSSIYDFHTILYPLIFGIFLKSDTYEKLVFNLGIVNSLTFSAYYLAAVTAPSKQILKGNFFRAIQIAVLAGVVTIYLQGRPEQLVPLLLLMPFLAYSKWQECGQAEFIIASIITATILGLLSPMTCIIYCAGLLGWVLSRRSRNLPQLQVLKSASSSVLIGLVISAFIIATVFFFTDFSFIHWITKTLALGNIDPTRRWTVKFASFFGANMSLLIPLWNIPVLASLVFIIISLARNKLKGRLLILFAFGFVVVYLIHSAQTYNWICFVPLILLASQGYSSGISKYIKLEHGLKFVGDLYLWIYSFVFARYILLFLIYLSSGLSFQQAKGEIERATNSGNSDSNSIAYFWPRTPSFVVMSNYERPWVTIESTILKNHDDKQLLAYEEQYGMNIQYIVLPQQDHLSNPPLVISNADKHYKLIRNKWSIQKAMFGWIRLGGSLPGYQYALYKLDHRVKPKLS